MFFNNLSLFPRCKWEFLQAVLCPHNAEVTACSLEMSLLYIYHGTYWAYNILVEATIKHYNNFCQSLTPAPTPSPSAVATDEINVAMDLGRVEREKVNCVQGISLLTIHMSNKCKVLFYNFVNSQWHVIYMSSYLSVTVSEKKNTQ